ncbi:MAG TPA: hypothetical protein VF056_13425 [Thermoleophilaceae bacterium]
MFSPRAPRLALLSLVGAVLAAATTAPGASAAIQRYASPGGTGIDCSVDKPCKITEAVQNAGAGAEVILNPGKYSLTATLATPGIMSIHGVAGKPRPVLAFSGGSQGGVIVQSGSTLRYVEIQQAAATRALFANGSSVDQVIATAGGPSAPTAEIQNSTIRNSIITASGTNGRALTTSSDGGTVGGTYRNVTAVATGAGGIPVEALGISAGNATLQLVNVLAWAGPGAISLQARTDSSNGAQATIAWTHTAYQSVNTVGTGASFVTGGNNRAEEPTFVYAPSGNFHLAAGSYMIDAGFDDPLNGEFDVDGDLRTIGKTDIGADEYVPPAAATTGAPSAITDSSATFNGTVEPNGAPTTYYFQYGTTAAYGSSTAPIDAGGGQGVVAASTAVAGLSPGTTYHYRLVAENSGGIRQGGDRIFTTSAAGTATPPAAPAAPAVQAFAGVKLVSTRLALKRGFITVRLSCPAATVGRCSGATKLSARRRRTSSRAAGPVSLGRARFSIAAGTRATVRVRVSRAGRRLFARTSRLSGRAATAAQSGAGESKTTVAAVTIRRRSR